MKLLKYIFSITVLIFLFSCSGTGTKNLGLILPLIEEKPNNKVFVTNQSGYESLMSNFIVLLNGQSIGTLGRNEILVGSGKSGKNTLMVEGKIDPVMGDSNTYIFDNKSNENRFFIINVNQRLLHRVPILNETTKQSFISNFR